jgi:hypothetical protein
MNKGVMNKGVMKSAQVQRSWGSRECFVSVGLARSSLARIGTIPYVSP